MTDPVPVAPRTCLCGHVRADHQTWSDRTECDLCDCPFYVQDGPDDIPDETLVDYFEACRRGGAQ